MQWTDEAIVLGARRHGESGGIVELMTRRHGRHLGIVRGARRLAGVLQPGNAVTATWQARLEEHLGNWSLEPGELRTARLIGEPAALYAVQWAAALLRFLPERDPHEALFETLDIVVRHLEEPPVAAALLARLELALLTELGFGLDLSSCAATGGTQDLVYVSPKSGRAVSRLAGQPYAERLFALPGFLAPMRTEGVEPSLDDIAAALRLTAHFLERDVAGARGVTLPDARAAFLRLLLQTADKVQKK